MRVGGSKWEKEGRQLTRSGWTQAGRRTYALAQLVAEPGQEGHYFLHVGLESIRLGEQHFFKGKVQHLLHQITALTHLQTKMNQQQSNERTIRRCEPTSPQLQIVTDRMLPCSSPLWLTWTPRNSFSPMRRTSVLLSAELAWKRRKD